MKTHTSSRNWQDDLTPLLGEHAWHSVTVDPNIETVSLNHFAIIRDAIAEWFPERDPARLKILEVACYAHTTGYHLARVLNSDVTLFELSAATLRLGRKLGSSGLKSPRLVIGDFHHLPFANEEFDFVFISSALHHTYDYTTVVNELLRVVAPDGVLMLDNEPCLRRACFYKFRCNRVDNFTAMEQHLYNSGWLKTIAEPYIGSRPETLFGMIENQTIPLDTLLGAFERASSILRLELHPELCMGTQEQRWLAARDLADDELAALVRSDLRGAVQDAYEQFGPVEKGLGFCLPTDPEIDDFAAATTRLLKDLPKSDASDQFRLKLTDLYGGALRVTLRRNTCNDWISPKRAHEMTLEPDGIYNAFPPPAKSLLGRGSLLPDIQTAKPSNLISAFPENEWHLVSSENGIRSLHPLHLTAHIHCRDAIASHRLFVLRFYAACSSHWPSFQIVLADDSHEYAKVDIYHPESHLLTFTLAQDVSTLRFIIRPLDTSEEGATTNESAPPPLSVAFAGLFELDSD